MTWRELAIIYPEFVQWAAQRRGPLPDGPIVEADYNRLKAEYDAAGRDGEARP